MQAVSSFFVEAQNVFHSIDSDAEGPFNIKTGGESPDQAIKFPLWAVHNSQLAGTLLLNIVQSPPHKIPSCVVLIF